MVCGADYKAENSNQKEFQNLNDWQGLGLTLEKLLNKLDEQADEEIRVYTVATTRLDKNPMVIRHLGSGPNLEGGLATLCTCKHSMRQNYNAANWENKWILGLTSRARNNGFCGEHYLFYMMKIEKAFESHAALFKHLDEKNANALQIKNAVKNRLGDIFEPNSSCTNPLEPTMYKNPHSNHSHGEDQWHDDIIYNSKSAPLLLGDVNNTFVWTKPLIKFKHNRGVGNMKLTLRQILSSDFVEGYDCLR